MADNDFRSQPNRAAAPLSRAQQDDPLAELARLIGQSEPAQDLGRDARRGTAPLYGEPTLDWPEQESERVAREYDGDRYAAAAPEPYDAAYDGGYAQQPQGDDAFEAGSGRQASALSTRLNGARDFARDYYVPPEQSRLREIGETRAVADPRPPAFLTESSVERYQFDDGADDTADDQAYALDEYQEDEVPPVRRRRGTVVVAAVLGLAIVGTAGAFAYRAMFGSSMLPALPPIIKADDGPNKIIPAKPKTSSDQADASDTGSGEKLVSREEQPVDMPAPANSTPRVVSTIPIFPDPNSGQAGVPNAAQPGTPGGGQNMPAFNAAAPPPPTVASTPPAPVNSIWPPAPQVTPLAAASAPAAPAPAATAPRKVHTVVIHSDQLHSDQLGSQTADASPTPPPLPAPAAVPLRTASPRPVMAPPPRPAPAARVDANAPLSIVPNEAPPPRLRTALARPAEAPVAARAEPSGTASGGYAVQVTSQRSETGAQAEFRALKAKFPNQLGGREPLIRRADLGAKGVYYRALVGPFASAEQATAMCSGLKSAGGSCIVQRN
jgi:hypothetical protein